MSFIILNHIIFLQITFLEFSNFKMFEDRWIACLICLRLIDSIIFGWIDE